MQLIQSQKLTMTSREIAELVGKHHRHVLRDLRALKDSLGGLFGGYAQEWTHPQNGQNYEEFVVDRDTCMTLLLGYDSVSRFKVVKRWQELEAQVSAPKFNIPTTLSGALRLAAEQAETIEAQQLLIEQQKPSVEFVESYVEADGLMGFRQVAKLLGANERKFRQMLLDQGVMYYLSGVLTPMSQHIKAGRFEVKTGEADNGHAFTAAKFTPKGVEYVSRLWRAAQ